MFVVALAPRRAPSTRKRAPYGSAITRHRSARGPPPPRVHAAHTTRAPVCASRASAHGSSMAVKGWPPLFCMRPWSSTADPHASYCASECRERGADIHCRVPLYHAGTTSDSHHIRLPSISLLYTHTLCTTAYPHIAAIAAPSTAVIVCPARAAAILVSCAVALPAMRGRLCLFVGAGASFSLVRQPSLFLC